jgi:hypothetical protein
LLVVISVIAAHLLADNHSSAHIVANEYSFAVEAPSTAAVGVATNAIAVIDSGSTPGTCAVQPEPFGCYLGAQWFVDYDQTRLEMISAERLATAPGECAYSHDDGNRVLLGCVSLSPSNLMAFRGAVWRISFRCTSIGAAALTLNPDHTFAAGANAERKASHMHSDTVNCVADSDGDGCSDAREIGPLATQGGQRNPDYHWDFYDVDNGTGAGVRDGKIDLRDPLFILGHFGHGPGDDPSDNEVDRALSGDPARPWHTDESNSGVTLTDVLNVLKSFGHDCTTS